MHVVRVKCALLFNQQQLFYIMQVVGTVIVCPCVGLKCASAFPCCYYRHQILIHEMRGWFLNTSWQRKIQRLSAVHDGWWKTNLICESCRDLRRKHIGASTTSRWNRVFRRSLWQSDNHAQCSRTRAVDSKPVQRHPSHFFFVYKLMCRVASKMLLFSSVVLLFSRLL